TSAFPETFPLHDHWRDPVTLIGSGERKSHFVPKWDYEGNSTLKAPLIHRVASLLKVLAQKRMPLTDTYIGARMESWSLFPETQHYDPTRIFTEEPTSAECVIYTDGSAKRIEDVQHAAMAMVVKKGGQTTETYSKPIPIGRSSADAEMYAIF